eukprot:CAMPEP_0168843616 /NCGR_PEP_ID=MMETSP0727-20121128/8307_1 /TAXON_ID=265536 /ORGANISM="Amphiprora sp., Strain CCMP467" /LENGTH=583 /DNA_ID=CAMNT_0008897221 /DNA_START=20 /DNA_END=1771 /DNA_ORIENTATION=-
MTAPASVTAASADLGTYKNLQSEFVVVVLAATVGTRLYPLTDASSVGIPKHLLPVAGVPILKRQLHQLEKSGFTECVVAISHEDQATIDFFKREIISQDCEELEVDTNGVEGDDGNASVCLRLQVANTANVTVVRLGEEVDGSVGAITQIETLNVVPRQSHIMIIPGDLVLFDGLVEDGEEADRSLADLAQTHRQAQTSENPAACTFLLSDVGEQDENGIPLKESSKKKKGSYAREEDDIEYIALSFPERKMNGYPDSPRVIWKQSKLEAEDDKDMTGQTPKLVLPKPRLRLGQKTTVRTDWTDVHVYVLSPWVRMLLLVRNNAVDSNNESQQTQPQEGPASLISMADDVLPLLITRQFLSIEETFGSKMEPAQVEDLMRQLSRPTRADAREAVATPPQPSPQPISQSTGATVSISSNNPSASAVSTRASQGYSVLAHVQKSAFRSSTIPAFIFASKEMISKAMAAGNNGRELLLLPPNSNIRHKFQTVILPDTTVGEKVTFKSTVVGRNCKLGTKCRLNNVILLDNVTLGDQVSLQNTVVGQGAVLGDNCSLNDCQIAPGKKILSGTKAKGEVFTDDAGFEE